LEVGEIRPWPGSMRWTLSGRPIASHDVTYEKDRCHIRIEIPQDQHSRRRTLGLNCLPWDVGDQRLLGMPIFRISCRSVLQSQNAEPRIVPFPVAPHDAADSIRERRAA
ncbi:MAG: hypothetical protein KDA75_07855, partial [Planctomycetaceae bacterium]|nr:hypothetical protein [Planctomycetaceae bacterium]